MGGKSHLRQTQGSSLSQPRDALLDGWGRLVGVNVTNTFRWAWKCWSPGTRRALMRQMPRPCGESCTPLINLTSICVKGMSLGTSPEADLTLTTQWLSRLHLDSHQESPLGLWSKLQYSSCPGVGQKLQGDPHRWCLLSGCVGVPHGHHPRIFPGCSESGDHGEGPQTHPRVPESPL